MLTQDAFSEHKSEYTVYRKTPTLDHYGNETNIFSAGGTITTMFTPITDEATIQTYGEKVRTMVQGIVYDNTEMEEHDQIELNQKRYEIISIKQFPSYRLIQVQKI
jgi:hypothetical protein